MARLLLVFVIFCLYIQSIGQVNLEDGLIAYYPFDGNALDKSRLRGPCIPYKTELTEGHLNNQDSAFYFNGYDAYVYAGSDNRGIIDQVSISAWIRTNSFESDCIVSKYNWIDDRGFRLNIKDGFIRISGRNNNGNYWESGPSTTMVSDEVWHHVVGIIDKNKWEIWVDCNLENFSINSVYNPYLANYEPFTIGKVNMLCEGHHLMYQGAIDEVRIYNRVLSTAEIHELCDAGTVGASNDLQNDNNFGFYPNPAHKLVNIINKEGDPIEVEIYDINSKTVGIYQNPSAIAVPHLQAGEYLFVISDLNGCTLHSETVIIK